MKHENYRNEINWSFLAHALIEFRNLNYEYIEVPWYINKMYTDYTFNSNNTFLLKYNNHLVGSAEQSFIYYILTNQIPYGKYCSITPCFRDEPILDDLHHKTFMKLELMYFYPNVKIENIFSMMDDVKNVYKKLFNISLDVVNITDKTYDLYFNGIEIGSYGIREVTNYSILYGTGLAEPRFSYLLNKGKINEN